MNVEHINPFVEASTSVLQMIANTEVKIGKLNLKDSPFISSNVAIIIGVTGEMKGQVIFSLSNEDACKIASIMMGGMPVPELDEISKSAIGEVGNMIMGNTATIFASKQIAIDITPPTIMIGKDIQISTSKMKVISIPLHMDTIGCKFDINVSIMD